MHWRFVILYKSGCYWQSAIVCLVFKVKKKARQTIYCFTLHRLLIAYYWTKNDTTVIHIITQHCSNLIFCTPLYLAMHFYWPAQYSFTVQNLLTSNYSAVHHCTGHWQLNHYTQLFFHWQELCATVRHRTFLLNPHEVAVQGSDQHCTQLYTTVQYIYQHCIKPNGTVIGTN